MRNGKLYCGTDSGRQRASLTKFPKNKEETASRQGSGLTAVLGRASSSFEWNDLRSLPGAFAECLFQAGGAAVLLQQIVEGLIGKLLE